VPERAADGRHDDIVDQGRDDLAESGPDDDAHGHVHRPAFDGELLEFFHESHCFNSSFSVLYSSPVAVGIDRPRCV
jgi:hypothetical protein